MKEKLLEHLRRGELRPSVFAETYGVSLRAVVAALETLQREKIVRRVGSYHVFGVRGIETYGVYTFAADERMAA